MMLERKSCKLQGVNITETQDIFLNVFERYQNIFESLNDCPYHACVQIMFTLVDIFFLN